MSSGYSLSNRSKSRLDGVHPDLVRVVERAIDITPLDFGVNEGLRSLSTQKKYVNEGKSQTLNSMHLRQESGYSHAVDFAVYLGSDITWDIKYYRKVIQAFFTAAIEEGVQIRAGGLWQDFIDGPHIELDRKYY